MNAVDQLGAIQAPASEMCGRLRNGQNFGVGGRVLEDLALVVSLADDEAVVDDHAAHRHLAEL